MTWRGYLFDLDGTLVDTAPDLTRALNHALAGAGIAPVDEALTRHWVGHGVRAMLTAALEYRGVAAEPERFEGLAAACIDHYAAHIADHSAPYPGVVESLATLGQRAPLAVVTNKPAGLTESLLNALALAPLFTVVVGRGTTAKPKPDAEPALYACRRIGERPERALFVGDSATDVACARAAGCPVVLYRHGYNHGHDPETLGADRVIDSFCDLL